MSIYCEDGTQFGGVYLEEFGDEGDAVVSSFVGDEVCPDHACCWGNSH
jgi:hypothetical protein